jgi:hypothetical protein
MSRYRHAVTGAEREISRPVGFPWQLVDEQSGEVQALTTKADFVARAQELGLSTEGTKAELEERIQEAEAAAARGS